jgi:hypothetical protein
MNVDMMTGTGGFGGPQVTAREANALAVKHSCTEAVGSQRSSIARRHGR